LEKEMVDRIVEVAGRLLFESEEFRRLIKDLDGHIPATN